MPISTAVDLDLRVAYSGNGVARVRTFPWLDRLVVVATQVPDNPGPSITNGAEALWCAVAERLELAVCSPEVILVEHYDRGDHAFRVLDVLDVVTFSALPLDPGRVLLVSPVWEPLGRVHPNLDAWLRVALAAS